MAGRNHTRIFEKHEAKTPGSNLRPDEVLELVLCEFVGKFIPLEYILVSGASSLGPPRISPLTSPRLVTFCSYGHRDVRAQRLATPDQKISLTAKRRNDARSVK
jgi:hypothetical protein